MEDYNTFLDHKESSEYKFHWDNENVYIVDMANPEHEALVSLLQDYFKVPNGDVIIDPPIDVEGQPYHYNPTVIRKKLAPDITIYQKVAFVPNPTSPHPGPLPSDLKLWKRQGLALLAASATVPTMPGIFVQEIKESDGYLYSPEDLINDISSDGENGRRVETDW
ncbi:12925_t:CDS:2 [Acaulospora colombiana]|uniref:12925_t:CDS:1 n=1 Tax=Acaulospora colombiana TaxID=27376 RepID=A0ACA9KTE6_9GLOM|nr:12925_t:CDS:2 [Acaulospora colombiana]